MSCAQQSEVLDEDKENFKQVLLGDGSPQAGNKFSENLECIQNALDKNSDIRNGGEGLRKFIRMLQDRVVLLPIECDSRDGALKIFQTLNDRGIFSERLRYGFKARMYGKLLTTKDKDNFVKMWNKLGAFLGMKIRTIFASLWGGFSGSTCMFCARMRKKPGREGVIALPVVRDCWAASAVFMASAASAKVAAMVIKSLSPFTPLVKSLPPVVGFPLLLSSLFWQAAMKARNWVW